MDLEELIQRQLDELAEGVRGLARTVRGWFAPRH
jgi:hypothetical protein